MYTLLSLKRCVRKYFTIALHHHTVGTHIIIIINKTFWRETKFSGYTALASREFEKKKSPAPYLLSMWLNRNNMLFEITTELHSVGVLSICIHSKSSERSIVYMEKIYLLLIFFWHCLRYNNIGPRCSCYFIWSRYAPIVYIYNIL